MTGIVWIHLSDWHQRGKNFDRTVVRDALMKDIRDRKRIDPELSAIDFIFVTGDIAFSGKTEEYDTAVEQFFNPLMKATGLKDDGWDRLFIVPGNHDADRTVIKSVDTQLKLSLENPQAVHDLLGTDWKREAVLSPFKDYEGFLRKYVNSTKTWTGNPSYSYSKIVDAGGRRVAIVGLNSAWHCGRNLGSNGEPYDYGFLIMGEPQIYDRLYELENTEELIIISLMHHPVNWLVDFDRYLVKDHLSRRCHFILHGHEHMARVYFSQSTIGEVVVIPGGASYERRQAQAPRYINSYNFVHLNFETDEGTVYLRKWSDTRNAWIEDNDTYTNGRFHFTLPKNQQVEENPHVRWAHRKLTKRYEKALAKRFYDEIKLSMRHSVVKVRGIDLVRHDVKYKWKVPEGEVDSTTHETMASDRVVRLVEKGKLNIKPYEAHYFRVNGQEIEPQSTSKERVKYEITLNEKANTIEYHYTVYMMTEDVYLMKLSHFTKKFQFKLQRDPLLFYDFCSVGGLGLPELKREELFEYELSETVDLCFPDQGYLIHWYPVTD